MHKMQTAVVLMLYHGLSMCMSVGQEHELCKMAECLRCSLGWQLVGPKKLCIMWGPDPLRGRGTYGGSYCAMLRLVCSQYCQSCSLGDRSDAAFSCQSAVATCYISSILEEYRDGN